MKNLTCAWFCRLPDATHDKVMGVLLNSGLLFRTPTFKRFLDAVEFFGADPQELRSAFLRANAAGPSPDDSLRRLGAELGFLAGIVDERQNPDLARDLHFRASLYYLLADWFTRDHQPRAKNYAEALLHFGRFRALCRPRIEKIWFPHSVGTLAAHFRVPDGIGPFPALVIVQGNDTVKEYMIAFEDFALDRGIATLTVDQPGWGESGLTGNKCRSICDLREFASTVVSVLQDRRDIRGEAIGIFGVDLGGLLASLLAGLEPRFTALASLAAPYHFKEIWPELPAVQRRMALRHTGAGSMEELCDWFDGLGIKETLSHVHCPALVVHGNKDAMVGIDNAFALAVAMCGDVEVKIVDGGEHICTQVLFPWLADYIFDWFSERLSSRPARAMSRAKPAPGKRKIKLPERPSLTLAPSE